MEPRQKRHTRVLLEEIAMPNSEITTLILRFRDLGIASGKTIEYHQEKIEQRGGQNDGKKYTWWGWWNKSGEQVPVELYTELLDPMKAGPITLYLLDSGQHKLYETQCDDIHWHARELVPSPEPEWTPEYYHMTKFLAWFRLTSIGPEVPTVSIGPEARTVEKTLQGLTSVRVDGFFRSGESRFGKYYGKQISSTQELIDQNRTIWFARKYDDKADREHSSTPPSADTTAPYQEPFPPTYVSSYKHTLLWLSDLHFGHHAFPESGDTLERNLALALEEDLKRIHKEELAGVLITGDLTWGGEKKEFDQALEFIKKVHSWSTLELHQFLCCPGNHDLRFSDKPMDKDRPVQTALAEARAAYSLFYEDLYRHKPNDYLSCGRRFLLGNHLPVEVVCLNTSFLQQKKKIFQGHGLVGRDQLKDAANRQGWRLRRDRHEEPAARPFPRAFRILVFHHHLIPVIFREDPYPEHRTSVVFDAEAIVRWIVDREVDLVLHGHMHEPFIARIARPVPDSPGKPWHEFHVMGLGSSGVAQDHLGDEERHNTYGLLEFGPESLQLSIRRIHPKSLPADQEQRSSIEIRYTHLAKS